MKQLKFARRRTPAEETEAAEALWWLVGQAVPADLPVFTREVISASGQRHLLAVARRCAAGAPLLLLVQAGHAAAIASARQYQQQPELWKRFWTWWVRESNVAIQHINCKLAHSSSFHLFRIKK